MAIYTALEASDLDEVARAFELGSVERAVGIPAGSINTNLWLTTAKGRFFLRHTTVRSGEDLDFEAGLLALLAEARFPAPRLLRTGSGAAFLPLAGGRVSVFRYIAGEERKREQLTPEHCERLGAELGRLHRLTSSFTRDRANPYAPAVVSGWLEELLRRPEPELREVAEGLSAALARALAEGSGLLPRGAIHGDLFIDNVLWVEDRVSAFLDFEMACRDAYALDLAITLNAWCFDGRYQPVLARALLRAYQSERPLALVERQALWAQALYGAVRYTASRIRDFHLSPLPADRLVRKDFRTYWARTRALLEMGPEGFAQRIGL